MNDLTDSSAVTPAPSVSFFVILSVLLRCMFAAVNPSTITGAWPWITAAVAWLIVMVQGVLAHRSLADLGARSPQVWLQGFTVLALSVCFFRIFYLAGTQAPLSEVFDGLHPLLGGAIASTLYAAAIIGPVAQLCLLVERAHHPAVKLATPTPDLVGVSVGAGDILAARRNYWAVTTDPRDRQRIETLMRSAKLTVAEASDRLAREDLKQLMPA